MLYSSSRIHFPRIVVERFDKQRPFAHKLRPQDLPPEHLVSVTPEGCLIQTEQATAIYKRVP